MQPDADTPVQEAPVRVGPVRVGPVLLALALVGPVCVGQRVGRAAEPPSVPTASVQAPGSPPPAGVAGPLSFQNDVRAVLTQAGCNMGACHGNLHGKGGFRLSLRGEDPQLDYASLVRQHGGRRVDRLAPERSLILQKATAQLPHEGGRRFPVDSLQYRILAAWLGGGAAQPSGQAPQLKSLDVQPPSLILEGVGQRVQLTAQATFSDGSRCDVTQLCVFETTNLLATVSPQGLVEFGSRFGETRVLVRFLDRMVPVSLASIPPADGFEWSEPRPENRIDQLIFAKLRRLRSNPSPPASDSQFVRRLYLDTLGVLPTSAESRRFVRDRRPDKRMRLIDQLLARPEFAEQWALRWSDLLRNEEKVLDARGVDAFHGWLKQQFLEARPLDALVRELVTATGSTYDNPPANYYRANRDPTTRGETTARLFLGVRLQCARCHNHPFDRWTQDDYYSWASVFARLDYKIIDNSRRDKLDKNEFVGEQIVLKLDAGEVQHGRTGEPAPARFLRLGTAGRDGGPPELGENDDRLEQLGRWLTHPDNRQFARNLVNLVWYHLLGRGLVEPIDDFRVTNPPSHPELLDYLAAELVDHDFDLRHLVRAILNSRTYQLASRPLPDNAHDELNFARARIRRLTAEQLVDAQSQVLGAAAAFAGYPPGTRAGQLAGVRRTASRRDPPLPGDRLLAAFGKPERLLACECERSNETTLNQAFLLIGGGELHEQLTRPGNRLEELAESDLKTAAVASELFWSALCREPSAAELTAALALSGPAPSSEQRLVWLQDLAWALLNSKEFLLRR